jgi:RimJ/RimL family protein N-acetyltransferase
MILFNIPSRIEFENVMLRPLNEDDFEDLYQAASDPLIWEQHPNKERYQRPVFEIYFKGAMESKSAFLVSNAVTGKIIGCSRFYDFDAINKTISIGYTFLSRDCWGKSFNKSLKTGMLNHAFQFVDAVIFHVGHKNIRSQKAMEKLGAIITGEEEMSYYGEPPNSNFIYRIEKKNWHTT